MSNKNRLIALHNAIESYLKHLSTIRQRSPHTVKNYQQDLTLFLQYCENINTTNVTCIKPDNIRQHIAQQHRQGKSGKSLQRHLSTIRDKAILELFYSSGLRLSELVNLDTDHFSAGDRTVKVLGKGNKERNVPVGKEAIKALELWLAQRFFLLKDNVNNALFLSKDGNRLKQRSIQQRLKEWGDKTRCRSPDSPSYAAPFVCQSFIGVQW